MKTFVRTEQEQQEIRMYGCTVAELRESIEDSITFQFAGPAMVVAGLISDAQEHVAYDSSYKNSAELVRQTLNQAKFVLTTYCMKGE